jgi:hypothetical protein
MSESALTEFLTRYRKDGLQETDSDVLSRIVPRELSTNLKWRRDVLQAGYDDPAMAEEIAILCARDCLFFINTFCWILEARSAAEWQIENPLGSANDIPFITREYQADVIRRSVKVLGKRDIGVPKSRETGVTWIYIAIAVWDWLFHPGTHIGLASKDEASVDDANDPDSLFSKIDFLIKRLPNWLLHPKQFNRNLTTHTLSNLQNGSTISGYAATGNIGRGGRKKWFLFDEFHFFPSGPDSESLESSQHVTRCRIFVSTANRRRGESGAFYDVINSGARNLELIEIDWKDDEQKARGLYESTRLGESDYFELKILDEKFWSEFKVDEKTYRSPTVDGENYAFILDGKKRSLYYDFECNRPGATAHSIAAELDRNPTGAAAQVFDSSILKSAMARVSPPMSFAEVYRDPDNKSEWKMDIQSEGAMTLWCPMEEGKPPLSEYSFGFDIALGTGGSLSSYSAIAGFDKRTGEQVMEWRSNRMDPLEFAELGVYLCRLFHNAYLIPEANGAGAMFIKRVTELGYGNLFHRRKKELSGSDRTMIPGYTNQDGGDMIFKSLQKAIKAREAHVHSTIGLREMGRYFYKNGKVVHSGEQSETDESARGKAHGDMAIAIALGWYGVEDWPVRPEQQPEAEIPDDSFLGRRLRRQKAMNDSRNRSYWSPYETQAGNRWQ